MKKRVKALGMLALAATMSMGMTSVANAAEEKNYTITIHDQIDTANSINGNKYAVYKIADFDVSGGVYTNIKLLPGFESLQKDLEAINGNSENAVAFANKAARLISNVTPIDEQVINGSSGMLTVKSVGYYLIVDKEHAAENPYLTTKYILKAVDGFKGDAMTEESDNEDIYVKTSKAGVTKKIVSEHDGSLEDANTVAIGDTITYELDADIPMYKADAENIYYELTDTMSKGLTFDKIESVLIKSEESDWTSAVGATYTVTTDTTYQETVGTIIKIKLTDDKELIANRKVKVRLTATLNEKANVGASGNPNSVDLTYSNKYTGGGENYTTPEDTVITYTGELKLVKKDKADEAKLLKGAEFGIYRVAKAGEEAAETDKTVTIDDKTVTLKLVKNTEASDENGNITVTGLDTGTYYAIETKAPEGYSIDEKPIKLVLKVTGTADIELNESGDAQGLLENYTKTSAAEANDTAVGNYKVTWIVNDKSEETILNAKGLSLPGTGGIGTTLFTFGGLALVLVAGVMFIVYTRKQKKQS